MQTRESIERRVLALDAQQRWNHNFMLPFDVETRPGPQASHGKNQVKVKRLQPLLDAVGLSGKAVLDVGCNEGFFSLHMAKAGAKVLGIDIDEHRITKAQFVREMYGEQRNVTFEKMDIYSQTFASLPRFDFCLCLGFIHRIPDPYTALRALADRSDMILFEWKALKFGPHDDAFAYFSPKQIESEDYYGTEYWLLSYSTLERILRRFGFTYFHRVDDPRQRRAILVAGRKPHAIFEWPRNVVHAGRVGSLLKHTKRYLRTVLGVITGKVNA